MTNKNTTSLKLLFESTDGFLRIYPIIVIISSIAFYFIKPSLETFQIVCAISISQMSVQVFKSFAQLIIKDKTIPFLGKGTRPKGAKNCGLIKNGKYSTSYGMPSGHSMLAASFATSMTLYIMENDELTDTQKNIYLAILGFLTLSVMSSRVTLGCHTPGQVFVGSGIGVGISYAVRYFFKLK